MSDKRDYRQIIDQEKQERTGHLNLGNCGLTDWPEELFEMDWLTHLVMDSQAKWDEKRQEYVLNEDLPQDFLNSIPCISPRISQLGKLVYLGLGRLGIKNIEYLDTLSHLSYLDLWQNQITEIKGLDKLSLTTLDLGYNQIREIKGLDNLATLSSLYLNNNQIKNIKGLDNLATLSSLELNLNQITVIEGLDNLFTLFSLDLSANQIRGIKGLKHLSTLSRLDLSDNQITEIKGLEKLSTLSRLDLSDNQITEIKGLEYLSALSSLYLSTNRITEIKGLDKLVTLSNLYLGNNEITEIKGLETLSALTTLYLGSNHITKITGLDTLSELSNLYLNANEIKEIEYLENLSGLSSLDLGSNHIMEIKGLRTLSGLSKLNLGSNQIIEIKGLETLFRLSELYLSSNRITEIKGLQTLSGLSELNLSFNQIPEIKGLQTLAGLSELSLSSNQITEIKGLQTLVSLSELNLSSNQITEIKGLEKLAGLSELNLSANQITEIKGLEKLVTLSNLRLGNNQIPEIKDLEKLATLSNLHLGNNQIQEIKGLEKLVILSNLDLSFNQISAADRLTTLPSLRNLKLRGNPTKDFPKALHDEDYFDSCIYHLKIWREEFFKDKSIKNKRVKLVLTGNGNAGKSSISEALQKGKCDTPKNSTHGVLIEQWEPDKDRQFHIWDFGGQEIYHGTHQLFMESDAIHLVVFDPETEQLPVVQDRVNTEEMTRNQPLAYWIANIKEHNGSNPLIVVQNKADRFPAIDNAANSLANDKGCKFVQVSATKGTNIDELAFQVNRALPLINEYNMDIPRSWQDIREYYLAEQRKTNNSKPVIPVSEFNKTAKEFEIPEKVWPTLLTFLHNNGVIYYSRTYLPDHIIVDQRWALDAIYKILDRGSTFYRLQREYFKGICKLQELWDAWGQEKPGEIKKLLLQFMRSCALCFPLTDQYYSGDHAGSEQSYVFPEFLNSRKPEVVANQEEAVKAGFVYYRFREPFLSYRTVQQLIVEYGTKTPAGYIWRNGILIKADHGFCCIEANFANHTLSIAIDKTLEDTFLPELLRKIKEEKQTRNWERSEDGVYFSPIDIEPILEKQDGKKAQKLAPIKQPSVLKIAISYAKEEDDKEGKVYGFNPLQELVDNLSILVAENKIRVFYDKDIDENDWDGQIRHEFANADLVIVLNSLNYNKREKRYIWEVEKTIIEKKLAEKELSVIRINVTDCMTRDFVTRINSFKQEHLPQDKLGRDKFFKDFIQNQIEEKILQTDKE